MLLEPGSEVGVYQVIGLLGAGGMGEVYRARDSRLHREVALKIVGAAAGSDPDRIGRFRREAQLLASLNHPNIAAIYGFEDAGGVSALVLELVEGPTLADRISRGALPLGEALAIATQIADALDAAHERGVVHRDLKPANIKLRPDGTVKVLDFGLAKAMDPASRSAAAAPSSLTNSPTLTSPAMTAVGVFLGTAAYMSPEQARGEAVDKRADIWAFGCVLFEMLTGRGTFSGPSVSDVVANILRSEPRWAELPAESTKLESVLRRCLEKDGKRRLRDIADVRLLLEEAVGGTPDVSGSSRRMSARSVPLWRLAAAAAVGAAIAGSVFVLIERPPVEPAGGRVRRFRLAASADSPLTTDVLGADSENIAISPDGTRLVYTSARDGVSVLAMRRFDRLEGEILGGSEGGSSPVLSPDGRQIVFATFKELKKIDAGGPTVTLCPVDAYFSGASWASDNSIVFAQGALGLFRVSAAGGTPERIAAPDTSKQERGFSRPSMLPNGAILYSVVFMDGSTRVMARRAGDHDATMVAADGFDAHYLSSGFLVYGQRDRLMAVRFDPSTLKASGTPVAVQEGVFTKTADGIANASFASDGTAVFLSGRHAEAPGAIIWLDASGARGGQAISQRLEYPRNLRLSPDGRRLAVAVGPGGLSQLWVYTLDGSVQPLKLTFADHNLFPIWSPDGRQIVFMRRTSDGASHMMVIPSDGSDIQPKALTGKDEEAVPWTWSPDGASLMFRKMTTPKLWLMRLADRTESLWLSTPFAESTAAFSPDGRWVAYSTNQTGADEIWVRPFPGSGAPTRVSDGGGERPIWSHDGKEIYFENHGNVLSAHVASQPPAFRVETPRVTFNGGFMHDDTDANLRFIDAAPDGRFIAVEPEQPSGAASIVVVQHWDDELMRLLPK